MSDKSKSKSRASAPESIPHGQPRAKLSADHQGLASDRLGPLWEQLSRRWEGDEGALKQELTAQAEATFQDWVDAMAEAVHAAETEGVDPKEVVPPSAATVIRDYAGTGRQLYAALLVFGCWARQLDESSTQSSLSRQARRASITPRALKNLLVTAGQARARLNPEKSDLRAQVDQLIDQIRNRRMWTGVDSDLLDDAATCLSILAHEEARKPVVDMLRSYMRCIAQRENDETPWRDVWMGAALEHLQILSGRMGRLAIGELLVSQYRTRGFWRDEIMTHVEQSLWTTNISYNKGLFGRKPDRDLLNAQQRAIKEGVEITRLFVYEPDAESEELAALRQLMRAQLKIGIKVLTVSKEDFFAAENGRISFIGDEDFMILDETYVYVTKTDLPGVRVTGASLISDQEAILSAKQWRREIMFKSRAWTLESVGDFP